jgi:hypothetical protein
VLVTIYDRGVIRDTRRGGPSSYRDHERDHDHDGLEQRHGAGLWQATISWRADHAEHAVAIVYSRM